MSDLELGELLLIASVFAVSLASLVSVLLADRASERERILREQGRAASLAARMARAEARRRSLGVADAPAITPIGRYGGPAIATPVGPTSPPGVWAGGPAQ
jgi:type II secretory pathway pseudopilin PulG